MNDITTTRFRRVVRPGSTLDYREKPMDVYVTIDYQYDRNQMWELSITGVEGPTKNGDARGSGGAMVDRLDISGYAPGWNRQMVDRLRAIAQRWHLNGMRAGSPRQEEYLRAFPVTVTYPESHLDKARQALRGVGLEPDPGFMHPYRTRARTTISAANGIVVDEVADVPYSYGSAWLHEPVPAEVLQWLHDLPATDKPHPWGEGDYPYPED